MFGSFHLNVSSSLSGTVGSRGNANNLFWGSTEWALAVLALAGGERKMLAKGGEGNAKATSPKSVLLYLCHGFDSKRHFFDYLNESSHAIASGPCTPQIVHFNENCLLRR